MKGVNEEELRTFLTGYRQFLLCKEGAYFPRICDILCRGSRSENLKRWVGYAREVWESALGSRFGFTINGKDASLEEILDLLYYADIIHHEPKKVAELDAMPKQDHAFLRLRAIDLLWPTLDALNKVGRIIRHIEEDDVDSIPVGPPVGAGRQRLSGSFGQVVGA